MGNPGILGQGGGGGSSTSTVWQEYGPGTVRVTGESRDTWTKGGGGGSSTSTVRQEYRPGTVRVTRESRDTWTRGGGGSSTSTVRQEYRPGTVRVTRESRDTRTRGGGSSTSTVRQEYRPGTVRVTGESRDTWTRGAGVPVLHHALHPGIVGEFGHVPCMSYILRNTRLCRHSSAVLDMGEQMRDRLAAESAESKFLSPVLYLSTSRKIKNVYSTNSQPPSPLSLHLLTPLLPA